jgi:hypothetical protein
MCGSQHLPCRKSMVRRERTTHALIGYGKYPFHSRGTRNSVSYIHNKSLYYPYSSRINENDHIHSQKCPFVGNSEIPTNCGEVALGSSESHDFPTSSIYTG